MLNQVLSSCPHFKDEKCPNQQLLEKLILFPQLSTMEDIKRICKNQCCTNNLVCFDQAEKVLSSLNQSDR